MSIRPSVGPVQHPALQRHLTQRAENVQNRIADTITRFAGSMAFVYRLDHLVRALDRAAASRSTPTGC